MLQHRLLPTLTEFLSLQKQLQGTEFALSRAFPGIFRDWRCHTPLCTRSLYPSVQYQALKDKNHLSLQEWGHRFLRPHSEQMLQGSRKTIMTSVGLTLHGSRSPFLQLGMEQIARLSTALPRCSHVPKLPARYPALDSHKSTNIQRFPLFSHLGWLVLVLLFR